MKTYILKPKLTFTTVTTTPTPGKTRDRATDALVAAIAPASPTPKRAFVLLPPGQPLPKAVIDPTKPLLKLGLDVHLEFIMAVAQKDHASPHAPRKFTNAQLIEQVCQWVVAVGSTEVLAGTLRASCAGSTWYELLPDLSDSRLPNVE